MKNILYSKIEIKIYKKYYIIMSVQISIPPIEIPENNKQLTINNRELDIERGYKRPEDSPKRDYQGSPLRNLYSPRKNQQEESSTFISRLFKRLLS